MPRLTEREWRRRYPGRTWSISKKPSPWKSKLLKKGIVSHEPRFGFYDKEELARLSSEAYLYIHCAWVEVEGLSCVEALREGIVPVIAKGRLTATSQFALDERSIFPVFDAKALAEKIDWWIEHREEHDRMRKLYAESVKKYDQTISTAKLIEMYKSRSRSGRRYPVIYLLHGARGDEASWITQGGLLPVLDSLLQDRKILVVFPNMNSYDSENDFAKSRHKGALESFFEVDGAVETSFVRDVVGATDSLFRTIPEKEARAIAGLSLGGMQALYISASSPDTFGYVGIFSAPLHSALRNGPYSSFYKEIDGKIDAQFKNPPLLYHIYVGEKDIYKATMEKFCNELGKKGYEYSFFLDEGGHQWAQWQSFAGNFISELIKTLPED